MPNRNSSKSHLKSIEGKSKKSTRKTSKPSVSLNKKRDPSSKSGYEQKVSLKKMKLRTNATKAALKTLK